MLSMYDFSKAEYSLAAFLTAPATLIRCHLPAGQTSEFFRNGHRMPSSVLRLVTNIILGVNARVTPLCPPKSGPPL